MAATYTIKAGDSLSAISQKYFGSFNMADTLARINNISDKNVIHPGMVITVPDVQDAEVLETTTSSSTKGSITKYFGWGVVVIAALLVGNEVRKRRKKNKVKPALAGVKKKKKRKK